MCAASAAVMCPWMEEENPVGNTHAAAASDNNDNDDDDYAVGKEARARKGRPDWRERRLSKRAGPLKNQATATAPTTDTLFLLPPR